MGKNQSKLGYIMDQFLVKGNDLSDYLHIDNSLVSKWRTGKRKISAQSEILNEIVDYFIALDSSTEFQHILGILRTAYPGVSIQKSDKMKLLLKRWLTEEGEDNYFLSKQISNQNVKMTQNVLYKGHDGRQRAAMDIIDLLLESTDKEELMVLDFDHFTWKYKDPEYHARWFEKYAKIIKDGHKITILNLEDRTYEEKLKQLIDWLGFYTSGNVQVYTKTGNTKTLFRPSLILLKDKAALFGMTADGFTSKMNVQITSDLTMINHCIQLYEAAKSQSNELYQVVQNQDHKKIIDVQMTMSRQAGDTIIKDLTPFCMFLPEELFFNILKENDVDDDRIDDLLNLYADYSNAFYKNIQHFTYRIFLDEEYLENAMINGDLIPYQYLSILAGKPIHVRKEYCCYHLGHLVNLMNTYKNFELSFGSFINKDHFNNMSIYLKQYKMTMVCRDDNVIYSKEAMMSDTLFTYYDSIWNTLGKYDKDRIVVEEKIGKLIRLHSDDL